MACDLPPEALAQVFAFLPDSSHASAVITCTRLREARLRYIDLQIDLWLRYRENLCGVCLEDRGPAGACRCAGLEG